MSLSDTLYTVGHYFGGVGATGAGVTLAAYAGANADGIPNAVFAVSLGVFMAGFGLYLIADGIEGREKDDEPENEVQFDDERDGEEVTVSA